MAVPEDKASPRVLSPTACRTHLRQNDVGRVAVIVDGHPEIFPVNYAVDEHDDIFFRTDPGTKLDGVARAQVIAFEIDGINEDAQHGWSVMAVGEARWLADPELLARAQALPLRSWAAGEKANIVRLHPDKVTGRWLYQPASAGPPGQGG